MRGRWESQAGRAMLLTGARENQLGVVALEQRLDGLAHELHERIHHGRALALPQSAKRRHGETFERNDSDLWMVLGLRDSHSHADAIPVSNVSLHQIHRANFD